MKYKGYLKIEKETGLSGLICTVASYNKTLLLNGDQKMIKKIKSLTISICLFLVMSGCMAITSPPLPETLQVVPPSPDVPSEIAAFSGIWEGTWSGMKDAPTTIVVEKIDKRQAEVLMSFGGSQPGSAYLTAAVVDGPVLEWNGERFPYDQKNEFGCPCKITFRLNGKSNMIVFIESSMYKSKLRADLTICADCKTCTDNKSRIAEALEDGTKNGVRLAY